MLGIGLHVSQTSKRRAKLKCRWTKSCSQSGLAWDSSFREHWAAAVDAMNPYDDTVCDDKARNGVAASLLGVNFCDSAQCHPRFELVGFALVGRGFTRYRKA